MRTRYEVLCFTISLLKFTRSKKKPCLETRLMKKFFSTYKGTPSRPFRHPANFSLTHSAHHPITAIFLLYYNVTAWTVYRLSTTEHPLQSIFTARIRRMGEGTVFSLSVHTQKGGGYPIQPWTGGGPRSRWGGGGGARSQIFGGRGVPSLSKGKNFWHQIWLDTCSDWEEKFLSRDSPLSKGKIFWHQI